MNEPVLGWEEWLYKFNEEKNQHLKNFTYKNTLNMFYEKNLLNEKKNQCKYFTKRKIFEQKSACSRFHEQKSVRNKFDEQNQFHKEKNNVHRVLQKKQHPTSFTNKKSARNNFHEQNQFREEKDRLTSFTKINM